MAQRPETGEGRREWNKNFCVSGRQGRSVPAKCQLILYHVTKRKKERPHFRAAYRGAADTHAGDGAAPGGEPVAAGSRTGPQGQQLEDGWT